MGCTVAWKTVVESIEASIASEGARRRGAGRKDDAKLRVMFVPTIISVAREGREAAERNYILQCLSVKKGCSYL